MCRGYWCGGSFVLAGLVWLSFRCLRLTEGFNVGEVAVTSNHQILDREIAYRYVVVDHSIHARIPGSFEVDCGELLKDVDAAWRLANLVTPGGILEILGIHSGQRGAIRSKCFVDDLNVGVASVDEDIQIFGSARFCEMRYGIAAYDKILNLSIVEHAQKI